MTRKQSTTDNGAVIDLDKPLWGAKAIGEAAGLSEREAFSAICGAIDLCQRVQPFTTRVGTYNPSGGDGLIHWHDAEPERPRIRIVNISEKEALKEKMT